MKAPCSSLFSTLPNDSGFADWYSLISRMFMKSFIPISPNDQTICIALSGDNSKHFSSEYFRTKVLRANLAPGSGDGGIDIRLLQRDPLGDILTLVQAKRYASHRKIDLSAVAALHGVADVEKAQRSLFVTTSDYLPSAQKFAGRTSIPMTLATSQDVQDWCRAASDGIVRDKSSLVTPTALTALLQSLSEKDPRILHASTGYSVIMNQFAIVLKETKHAALIMAIPARTVSDDGYGQRGIEVPDIGPRCLERLTAECVFRAKRTVRYGDVTYWNGRNLFGRRNGEPMLFDLCD